MKTENLIGNEKGLALPLALLVMVVLFLLGTTLLYFSRAETVQATHAEKKMQAHYLARTGVQVMAEWLYLNIDNHEKISKIVDDKNTSMPVRLREERLGETFKVTIERVEDNDNVFRIISEGSVLNELTGNHVTEVIRARFDFGFLDNGSENGNGGVLPLPDPDDIETVFPDDLHDNGGWSDPVGNGNGEEGLGWVAPNGNLKDGNDEDSMVDGVYFPEAIDVRHIEGSDEIFYFYAKYMLFANTDRSLYIHSKNTLNLHSNIIVFMGPVELRLSGNNYSDLTLNKLGEDHGRVYFFDDVVNNSGDVILEKGVYCFGNATIRSTGEIFPPLGSEEGLRRCIGDDGGLDSILTWEWE